MRTRLGLKVLGLSALVMGVMAIGTAGVAQAEKESCWGYMNGAELKCFSAELEAKPVLAIENNSATLIVGTLNIEVLCKTAELVGDEANPTGGMLTKEGSILLGQVLFGGCISLSKTPTLTQLTKCTPKDPIDGEGKIITEKGTGLIVLHKNPSTGVNEPVVELKPDVVNGPLAKIFLGASCAVSEELIVKGKLILQDFGGKADFETHKKSPLNPRIPRLKTDDSRHRIGDDRRDGRSHARRKTQRIVVGWPRTMTRQKQAA